MKNATKNKLARQLTYKTVIGVLPIFQRFASDLDVFDIDELSTIILNMSCDEFCDFKFKEKD